MKVSGPDEKVGVPGAGSSLELSQTKAEKMTHRKNRKASEMLSGSLEKLELRKAEAADEDALAAMEEGCFDVARRDSRRILRESLKNPLHEVWVLSGETGIVAALFLRRSRSTLRIHSIATVPSMRGLGLGERLLNLARQRARELGMRRISLEADADDPKLLGWYESRQFAREKRLTSYYGEGRDAWRLSQPIAAERTGTVRRANLLVVSNPDAWKLPLEGVEILSAKAYLSAETIQRYPDARVFNLCRSYAYQSLGYYVSLLAEARGHRAIPSVATLWDFRSVAVARSLGEEIDDEIQAALRKVEGGEFTLAIYFGQVLDREFSRLASQLYRLFPAPLVRIQFTHQKQKWILASVVPLTPSHLPDAEMERLTSFAQHYFGRRRHAGMPRQRFLYDLAILVNPNEANPPSNARALANFREAAREVGFFVELITTEDADRITEFDALFLRETTAVDHPTYHLSRLAHAEGLVVIDDPWSILKSANKVFLAESMTRAKVPVPKTWVLTRSDLKGGRLEELQLPCVLKLPDGAFSHGVRKVETVDELRDALAGMLKKSELILAQEFVPSDYDWRIGVLDRKPLFACKYYMAPGHWQIYNWTAAKPKNQQGRSETMHVEFAPANVVDIACRAADLVGDGFYGVDIKEIGDRLMVMEVNDNPSVDAGIEDAALGLELYRRVARSFRRRIEQARA